MSPITALARSAFALWLLAPATTGQEVIVQGGGFALQMAIDQASAGAILIVRTGYYTPIDVNKGIAILCDPDVTIANSASTPSIAVHDLPANERFQLRGATLFGEAYSTANADIRNNQGPVFLENIIISGAFARLMFVHQSQQVGFTGCTLERVDVNSSNVAFADCTLRGTCSSPPTPRDCNALAVVASRVSISGGAIRGQNSLLILPPTPAIYLDNGTLTIAGDTTTLIAAGIGMPSQPAILTTTGTVLLAPTVQVTAVGPPMSGGAQVRVRATPAVRASSTRSGQLFTVRTFCEAGSATVLFADAPRWPTPTLLGDFWFGPNALLVDAGVVPARGMRTRSFILPPLPRAEPTVLQAAALLLSGEIVVGPPTAIVQN